MVPIAGAEVRASGEGPVCPLARRGPCPQGDPMESHNTPSASAEERPQTAPNAGAPASTPADDELLGVIADVERQLAALRTHRAQHEETRARWSALEQELARRSLELTQGSEKLRSEQERLVEGHAKLKTL